MPINVITTVTKAADSYDLTTLAAVKGELEIDVNSKDAVLEQYIGEASTAIAQYCNQPLVAETVQDVIYPARDPQLQVLTGRLAELQLSRWPVIEVVSIVENAVTLVEGVDFIVDPKLGKLYRLGTDGRIRQWSAWPKTVQFRAGFEKIPKDVAGKAIAMVVKRYAAKGRDPNLRTEDIPGVVSRSWWIATGGDSGNMPPDITDVLDNYRVNVIA
ncbi:phage head-tail connector protein [Bradyrhizobium sp. SZCCHNR1020]|uniref:phage head-tail connector protein n=1 Tax=Bradyrhizobium sp. SZCCHNR1020 TaxID=3057343 RepID=UPI002916C227|nr:phage head-tail connector protein [Bradyrhizobium sp. SZCCHNR1020]